MAEKRQPRRSALPSLWMVVKSQNTTDDVFIDLKTKRLGQVLCNPGTPKTGIAPFEFTDGLNQFGRWPFGTGLAFGM